jgi:hypothetical protein
MIGQIGMWIEGSTTDKPGPLDYIDAKGALCPWIHSKFSMRPINWAN